MKKIMVLVVDDSALVREILAQGLAMDQEIEVVGTAPDAYVARDKIVELRPDVVVLDGEMSRMGGVEFLHRLMPQYPLPVVIVSTLTKKGAALTLAALEAGAVEVVAKPSTDIAQGLGAMLQDLRAKVKIAAASNIQAWMINRQSSPEVISVNTCFLDESSDKVVAIGASTGGTEAIRFIMRNLPAAMPGMVIVQHMPAEFTRQFALSLNDTSPLEIREAKSGDRVMPGRVLIAPGDQHMEVYQSEGQHLVRCEKGENVNGHCPSVEVLFQSVAQSVGTKAVGVMLTGMGDDGAEGMLAMRRVGARTIAQDEATSVVFDMPRVAFEKGGVECLIPLPAIPETIIDMLSGKST